jgi:hypothetical protein
LLQHGARIAQPVLVAYDGSESAGRAVELAVHLARAADDGLAVLLPASSERSGLARRLAELLGRLEARARLIEVLEPGLAGILQALRSQACATLVLNSGSRFLETISACELAADVECPVVVVR